MFTYYVIVAFEAQTVDDNKLPKALSFEAFHGHTHLLVYSDMLYLRMYTTGGVDVPCKN